MRTCCRPARDVWTIVVVRVLLAAAAPATVTAQGFVELSSSTIVTWVNEADAPNVGRPLRPPRSADGRGQVEPTFDPLAVLVIWRGAPGWPHQSVVASERPAPGSRVAFSSEGVVSRDGTIFGTAPPRRLPTVIRADHLNVELWFDHATRTARVNGIAVTLPEDDNVILVDDADRAEGPRVVGTSRLEPDASRSSAGWTMLRSSADVVAFLRCDVPWPADVASSPAALTLLQEHTDDRCEAVTGRRPSR